MSLENHLDMSQGLKMTAAGRKQIEHLTSEGWSITFFLSHVCLLNEYVWYIQKEFF